MNDKLNIIGVYEIEGHKDVHLIELLINEKPSLIDVGQFTQENPSQPKDKWQVAYDEYYLNSTGEKVIGDFFDLPINDNTPTRLTFFLYFINFDLPLITQFGIIELQPAIKLPKRLESIITFEDVD